MRLVPVRLCSSCVSLAWTPAAAQAPEPATAPLPIDREPGRRPDPHRRASCRSIWDARQRPSAHGDRAVRHGAALRRVATGGTGLEHRGPRSRPAGARRHRRLRARRARRCCSSRATTASARRAATPPSGGRSPIPSPPRCSGASRSRPRTAGACWSMRRRSSCATRTAWPRGCAQSKQGSFSLDESRSAVYLPRTKGFPKNTEVEVTLTFTSGEPAGPEVQAVAPSAQAVTVREHHSLVEAPDAGYAPRRFDPRVGVIPLTFYDYGTPITAPLEQRWIMRHRLQKKDPAATHRRRSRRSSTTWTAARPRTSARRSSRARRGGTRRSRRPGSSTRSRCACCRADADPMDVRYNVINWVHRTTRGWSYGSSVVDPRTGEIVKGVVTLDSQRVRQNVLIGSGLEAPWACRRERCRRRRARRARRRTSAISRRRSRGRRRGARARAPPAAVGARGRAHARLRAQLRREQLRARVGDGLPRAARRGARRRLDLSHAYATGIGELRQVRDAVRVHASSPRHRRSGRRSSGS